METLITSDCIWLEKSAPSKPRLLQTLSQLAAEKTGYRPQVIFDALCERERLGSTAMGHGVAIPHVRLVGLPECQALFLRLHNPVDFDSLDRAPVDLVYFLLAPAVISYKQAQHLETLAKVSRRLSQRETGLRLRAAQSAGEIAKILNEHDVELLTAA